MLVVIGASHLLVFDLGRDPVRAKGTQHLHESHGIDVTHLVHERAVGDLLARVFREVLPEFAVLFDLWNVVRMETGLLSDAWLWRSTAQVRSPKTARLTALYLGTLSYRTSLFKSIFLRPSSNCLMNTTQEGSNVSRQLVTYLRDSLVQAAAMLACTRSNTCTRPSSTAKTPASTSPPLDNFVFDEYRACLPLVGQPTDLLPSFLSL